MPKYFVAYKSALVECAIEGREIEAYNSQTAAEQFVELDEIEEGTGWVGSGVRDSETVCVWLDNSEEYEEFIVSGWWSCNYEARSV